MNRTYEELALNAWPALETHHYDGWLLKYSNGYTKRANSVYPIYDSTIDFEEKIDFCENYYSRLGVNPTFKMNDSDMLRMLDMCLEDRGYHVLAPTDVMTICLEDYEKIESKEYQVYKGFSEEWSKAYTELIGISSGDEKSATARKTLLEMLMAISQPSLYVSFEEDGKMVAVGNAVIERNYLGIFNIIVLEEYRGKGYGHQAMNALIAEGMKMGATEAYLQVVCENQVAVNLYKKMGFEKLYTYWYRRKED